MADRGRRTGGRGTAGRGHIPAAVGATVGAPGTTYPDLVALVMQLSAARDEQQVKVTQLMSAREEQQAEIERLQTIVGGRDHDFDTRLKVSEAAQERTRRIDRRLHDLAAHLLSFTAAGDSGLADMIALPKQQLTQLFTLVQYLEDDYVVSEPDTSRDISNCEAAILETAHAKAKQAREDHFRSLAIMLRSLGAQVVAINEAATFPWPEKRFRYLRELQRIMNAAAQQVNGTPVIHDFLSLLARPDAKTKDAAEALVKDPPKIKATDGDRDNRDLPGGSKGWGNGNRFAPYGQSRYR